VFFIHLRVLRCGSQIATTNGDLRIRRGRLAMMGKLTNISTDTLLDMLYIMLAGEDAITSNDAAEIEIIQRELQRRDGAPNWSFGSVS
jgi:hypothetical protein